MPKILITGANGQVGHALQAHSAAKTFTLAALSRDKMDITSEQSIMAAFDQHHPDIVINTAAYTAVDKAESEHAACAAANHTGAELLAMQCHQKQIPLIHLSTDYVFDGAGTSPYKEDDAVNPVNYYGKSKLLGEQAVRAHCEKHVILRVSGIFSRHGHNFLNTMLRLGNERDTLNVVADQTICPTSADDIATTLFTLCQQLNHWGTYHYCSNPITNWHEFASTIFETAKKSGPIKVERVNAIQTEAYPTPATRPAYSVLDCSKIKRDYGITQSDWQQALNKLIKGSH